MHDAFDHRIEFAGEYLYRLAPLMDLHLSELLAYGFL